MTTPALITQSIKYRRAFIPVKYASSRTRHAIRAHAPKPRNHLPELAFRRPRHTHLPVTPRTIPGGTPEGPRTVTASRSLGAPPAPAVPSAVYSGVVGQKTLVWHPGPPGPRAPRPECGIPVPTGPARQDTFAHLARPLAGIFIGYS